MSALQGTGRWRPLRSAWSYIAFEGPWGPRDAEAEIGGQRPADAEAEGQRSGSQRDQDRSPNKEVLGHGART